jgi:hypothetical protein
VGDLMLLTATVAIGLVLALRPLGDLREWLAQVPSNQRADPGPLLTAIARRQGPRFLVFLGVIQVLICFLMPVIPSLIAARLRRPRPPIRDLVRQPGLIACVAVCLSVLVTVDLPSFGLGTLPPHLWDGVPGAAVVISWLMLLATRNWKPEAS